MIAAARRCLRAALAVVRRLAKAAARKAGPRLRWMGAKAFRGLALGERWLRRLAALGWRAARRLATEVTPRRAVAALVLASAAALAVAQLLDYRAVEIGQPGYAGLPAASPPRIDVEQAGQPHSYLLLIPALLAAAFGVRVWRGGRLRLGRGVLALGLLSLLVVLIVDRPAGLDAGVQASRYSGAHAVLLGGFYLELAAAIGLIVAGGLLVGAPKAAARYHARPCRTRINSLGRAGSALRRRLRPRASRPGRGARRASRRRSGEASAPASPR